ncbi:hypothetical protein D6C87_05410 [Aureobasidium pullulans]|uniref:Uncharacterized protein n=1 Tax=Aureobasidium pullulans TaxID=5580 RepID=A0AB38M1U4_AURPU|nr:hypothetical protein D6C94_03306 [Aureobasidium pullulans]THZ41884.1 hypothetical protein D6C87_05410 [Aureobasidium pullulans]
MTAGQVCLLLVTNDEVKEWNSRPTRGLGPELKRNRTLGRLGFMVMARLEFASLTRAVMAESQCGSQFHWTLAWMHVA